MMIRLLQTIHIIAVAVFLGNIMSTLVWKLCAEKTGNVTITRHALSVALKTDKAITLPSVVVITLSGFWLIVAESLSPLDNRWLLVSIGLWLTSAVLAIFYLVPSLKRLDRLLEDQSKQENLSVEYLRLSRQWNIVSAALIVSPLLILVLMVLKVP